MERVRGVISRRKGEQVSVETVLVPRLAGYLIPRDRSVDIDEPEHLRIAEGLMGLSPRA